MVYQESLENLSIFLKILFRFIVYDLLIHERTVAGGEENEGTISDFNCGG